MTKQSLIETLSSQNAKVLARRILSFARPYLGKLLWGLLCMIIVAAATAASAKMMKPIIDDIFIKQDQNLLYPVTFLVLGLFLIKGIFSYLESILMAHVGFKITSDIQRTLFTKVIHADLAFFQMRNSGDLVSRFINDVGKLTTAVTGTLTNLGKDFLTLVFFIIVMFSEDLSLSIVVFFILPIAILPVVKIGRKMRKASKRVQEETSGLHIMLTQAFQGIRLVKSYCLEKLQIQAMDASIDLVFSRTLKGVRTKSMTHPIMEFLGGVAIAVVIFYGGAQVIGGGKTPGAFFAFITALIMSYEPLKRLANLSANFQEQMAAASRVFEVMDYPRKIQSKVAPTHHHFKKGEVVFENVSFSYDQHKSPLQQGEDAPQAVVALRNLNLSLKAGQKSALVGPSGGGKTTLMNLISRFYDPTQGRLLIDGEDIKEMSLDDLRENIALVSQEVFLFDDTIRANIACGAPNASEDQVIKAAQDADAHDFIMSLPQGYDTPIGEAGMRLSGGQRQRLSIARAFLKNAPILLMDEPTSALDTQSEMRIQEALDRLASGRTTLIIAHRLSTVQDANRIFFIDDGQIKASGTHQELEKSSQAYRALVQAQLQGTRQVKETLKGEKDAQEDLLKEDIS